MHQRKRVRLLTNYHHSRLLIRPNAEGGLWLKRQMENEHIQPETADCQLDVSLCVCTTAFADILPLRAPSSR